MEKNTISEDGGDVLIDGHLGARRRYLRKRLLQHLGDVDGRKLDLLPPDPAEGEKVFDQRVHLPGALANFSKALLSHLVRRLVEIVFDQHFAVAVDRAEGSAKIVGDAVAERLELPVGGAEI